MVITRANAQTTMSFTPKDRVLKLAASWIATMENRSLVFSWFQKNFAMQSKCAKKDSGLSWRQAAYRGGRVLLCSFGGILDHLLERRQVFKIAFAARR